MALKGIEEKKGSHSLISVAKWMVFDDEIEKMSYPGLGAGVKGFPSIKSP